MSRLSGVDALLHWCKLATAGYPGVNVTNFTTSWKDGLAFCALMHRFNPKKIPFETLSPENALDNLALAFKVGEEDGIAQLLDPEDLLIVRIPDQKSNICYISLYVQFIFFFQTYIYE